MVRVDERAVRSAVLGEVRDELRQRAPEGGYRAYDAPRVSSDVREAFAEVAKGKPATDEVKIGDVVDAYATKLKAAVDLVNVKGPAWLSAAEAAKLPKDQLGSRVSALRAELARGEKELSMDAITRNAARFVADHSAPIGDSGNAIDVFFPAFDVGNAANWDEKQPGIDAHLVTDAKDAVRLLAILKRDAGAAGAKRLDSFDPKKELLIIVRGSDDETHWYPAAIDKKTGKARGFDTDHNEVDFANVESKADFEALFGRGSAKGVKDDDWTTAASERLQKIIDRGTALPIEKMDPPGLDVPALTSAASDALAAIFQNFAEIPAKLDLSAEERTTLEAIRSAVHDGQRITVGERYGDPILLMPRKFAGAPTEDYWVGWAVKALIEQTPELKRFYNVSATNA